MSRSVFFAPLALLELEQAIAWYEEQRPGLGNDLRAEVDSILRQIRVRPERYTKVSAQVRRARLHRFKFYNLYFTDTPDRIDVVAVFHGKRSPESLRPRLH